MSDVVEKVARELAFNSTPLTPKGWDECRWPDDWDGAEQRKFRAIARAALAAVLDDMAEPSEGMVTVGTTAIGQHYSMDEMDTAWKAALAQYRKENLP